MPRSVQFLVVSHSLCFQSPCTRAPNVTHSLQFSKVTFSCQQADHKICLSLLTFPVENSLPLCLFRFNYYLSAVCRLLSLVHSASCFFKEKHSFKEGKNLEEIILFSLTFLHHPLQEGLEFGMKDGDKVELGLGSLGSWNILLKSVPH